MQVEFKPINGTSKEITITVPAERVNKAYEKYLHKAAKKITIPGFRTGKAPLSMVERQHADSLMDYFYKDFVDEVFDEAAVEHDIHYLLFPEVKDIIWEKGADMILKIEVEHEPTIDFVQLEGLNVPYQPQILDEEVDNYLLSLSQENGRVEDIEIAEDNDMVQAEISFKHGGESYTRNAVLYAGETGALRILEGLIGVKTGDKLELPIAGRGIKLATQDASLPLENDFEYPCSLVVNSITRTKYPELDDEFAKDMEFDSMEQMRAKIAEDMKLHIEHVNINRENAGIVNKLFQDNKYDMPYKTINYLAAQEADKIENPEYRKFYEYQYQMQITQEMIYIYTLNNLRRVMPLEVTEEMMEEYLRHEAILSDMSVEAYKEANKDDIGTEQFADAAQNFFILRKIAESSSFFVPEPVPEEEILEETEFTNDTEETKAEEE